GCVLLAWRCSIPASTAWVLQVFVPAPMGIRRQPARHYQLFADGWSAVTRRLVTDGLPLVSVWGRTAHHKCPFGDRRSADTLRLVTVRKPSSPIFASPNSAEFSDS